MKRLGGLWPRVVAFGNLRLGWRRARRGKGRATAVADFDLSVEREILRLQQELIEGRYLPGAYRQFTLYERKPRLISAAPLRDRVVHHALMNVIEPPLDKRFIDDCYACRRGRGVHAAVDRYQTWARRYAWVMKVDIRRYFPSIDHHLLKRELAHRIKDPDVLALLGKIIDGAIGADPVAYRPGPFPGDDLLTPLERPCGIPIGNLTSQFFANLYLDRLDHRIKEDWRVPAYLRYVDDLVFLADDKDFLWEVAARLRRSLAELRLELHPRKVQLMRSSERVDLFGYVVAPGRRWLRNDNGHRFARRLRGMARAYAQGRASLADFRPSLQAWIGHARHGETEGLRRDIFSRVSFVRDTGAGTGR